MENQKDMDNTSGQMEVLILEHLCLGRKKGKGSGGKATIQMQISMMESIIKIKSMGMEYLSGKVAMCIRVTTQKMREMGMGRCTGQMVHHTKESGILEYNMDLEY
jgi:hypothetical protein